MTPKFTKGDHAIFVETHLPDRPGVNVSIEYGLGIDPDGGPYRIRGFMYFGAPQPSSTLVPGKEILTQAEWALVCALGSPV